VSAELDLPASPTAKVTAYRIGEIKSQDVAAARDFVLANACNGSNATE
jgi:hypothetical protein